MEHIGEIPSDYKREMMNRAVHAAARGGNLKILRDDLLADCSDVFLAYRDIQGSTILHAAAGKGQVEVRLLLLCAHSEFYNHFALRRQFVSFTKLYSLICH